MIDPDSEGMPRRRDLLVGVLDMNLLECIGFSAIAPAWFQAGIQPLQNSITQIQNSVAQIQKSVYELKTHLTVVSSSFPPFTV